MNLPYSRVKPLFYNIKLLQLPHYIIAAIVALLQLLHCCQLMPLMTVV